SAKEIYDRNRETYGPGIEEGEKGQEASHFLNRNTYKQVFRTQVHAQEKCPISPSRNRATSSGSRLLTTCEDGLLQVLAAFTFSPSATNHCNTGFCIRDNFSGARFLADEKLFHFHSLQAQASRLWTLTFM
ncbi:hypothetical protein SK128_004462, partial [Halocaridina rubra]